MKYVKFFSIILICISFSGCSSQPTTNVSPIDTIARKATIPTGNFYFYSTTCLHCKTVSNYVADNKLREKGIHYFELEVSSNPSNAIMLKSVGERCNIKEEDLAVPLLWYNQTCYTSSDEIINYFDSLGLSDQE